ncbi:CLUMA_CG001219, isoform A [Clunio marinus]|uniref:CLUMA_CG001219, isoform A n=1 Tax=Clunio marinus TaxID=568069 RepID=A0A1J1HMF8_9DIPT|nr:CLUMA_CG001219, isoform A [Clunio marinus]
MTIFVTILLSKSCYQMVPKVIIHKVVATYNDSIVDLKHVLDAFPNDTYYLSANATFLSKLDTFFCFFSLDLLNGKGKYETFIKNGPTNICSSFKNLKGNAVVRTILRNKNFSKRKFPTTCPVESGFYYIENFELDERLLAFKIFESKYLIKIILSKKVGEKLVEFINFTIYAESKDREKYEKEKKKSLEKSH